MSYPQACPQKLCISLPCPQTIDFRYVIRTMAIFAYGRGSTKEQTTKYPKREFEQAGYNVACWIAGTENMGTRSACSRPRQHVTAR